MNLELLRDVVLALNTENIRYELDSIQNYFENGKSVECGVLREDRVEFEKECGIVDSMYNDFSTLVMGASNLFDEVDESSWEKDTIRYVNANYNRLVKLAKNLMSSISRDSTYSTGIEDVMQDVMCYFYRKPDYSYERARQASEERGLSSVMELRGLVENTLRLHIKKLNTIARNESEMRVDNCVLEDEHELNLIDVIPDESVKMAFLETEYNLDSQLKALEVKRYIYGMDIYFVLYSFARLGKDKFTRVLEIFGYSQKELNTFRSKIVTDDEVMSLLHVIETEHGKDNELIAIEKIAKYVYGRRDIDRTIAYILSESVTE